MKTALELNISEAQHSALLLALAHMESGKMKDTRFEELGAINGRSIETLAHTSKVPTNFNMTVWAATPETFCGTVCCIGGTAELLAKTANLFDLIPPPLEFLFYPELDDEVYFKITLEEATANLRLYLETGTHPWDRSEERTEPSDYRDDDDSEIADNE